MGKSGKFNGEIWKCLWENMESLMVKSGKGFKGMLKPKGCQQNGGQGSLNKRQLLPG